MTFWNSEIGIWWLNGNCEMGKRIAFQKKNCVFQERWHHLKKNTTNRCLVKWVEYFCEINVKWKTKKLMMCDNFTVNCDTNQSSRLYFGYLSVIVCSFGIAGNIFNVIVWSSFKRQTSTNILLVALAVADMTSLLFYLIFAAYFFLATGPYESYGHSKGGMYLVLVCFHEFIAFASLSSWFTISLGIFRYFKVCRDSISNNLFTLKHAKRTIVFVVLFSTITTIPFYFYYEVVNININNNGSVGNNSYWIRHTTFAKDNKVSYQMTILWLYGVFVKVVPSALLIYLSYRMIMVLMVAKRRRQDIGGDHQVYSRTTVMLLVILFIYIINQLTIGISAFVSGLSGGESHFFYFLIYSSVGDILDLTTLLNSALNFLVYISINIRFRNKAIKIVKKICSRQNYAIECTPNHVTPCRKSDLCFDTKETQL